MTYTFTKLNNSKPNMIAAASKDARQSAQQIADDSGSVGDINQRRKDISPLPAAMERAVVAASPIRPIKRFAWSQWCNIIGDNQY